MVLLVSVARLKRPSLSPPAADHSELALTARDGRGVVTMTTEAKADGTFGDTSFAVRPPWSVLTSIPRFCGIAACGTRSSNPQKPLMILDGLSARKMLIKFLDIQKRDIYAYG